MPHRRHQVVRRSHPLNLLDLVDPPRQESFQQKWPTLFVSSHCEFPVGSQDSTAPLKITKQPSTPPRLQHPREVSYGQAQVAIPPCQWPTGKWWQASGFVESILTNHIRAIWVIVPIAGLNLSSFPAWKSLLSRLRKASKSKPGASSSTSAMATMLAFKSYFRWRLKLLHYNIYNLCDDVLPQGLCPSSVCST